MDPNQPQTPSATVDEIDVDIEYQPPSEPFIQAPLASSIFRDAREPAYRPGGEELKQWQEEEFQRKLRGEYEAAQRRIGEVVTESLDHPLHLSSIRIVNPPRTTRSSFLSSLLSPFISPIPQSSITPSWLNPSVSYGLEGATPPKTLHEILYTTKMLTTHLRRFDIFQDQIDVKLEPAKGGVIGDVDLVLGIREKGRVFLKAGTEVGGGEGGFNVTGRLRNVFGGAESLELNASKGTRTKSAYQLNFTTPLAASPLLDFSLSAFALNRDHSAFASHLEQTHGGRAKFSARAPWGAHDITYEMVQRDITNLTKNASLSIRELAQPSTKASVTHTFTRDTRDDPWMGSAGSLLKISYEYAGLPGSSESVNFLKSTAQSQLSRVLSPGSGWHYSISSLTTMLIPLNASRTSTQLPDRVFLGGPNSIRGWKIGGIGARDGSDSLGGDLAWALGVSVFAPFPTKKEWPVKLHGFLNTGRVVGWESAQSFANNVARMYSSPNMSVGLGLLYRLDPIRVEVNFALPLIGRKGEGWARGLNVGIGLEFL
ncbi:hypothetical protein QFC20_001853 [Naganishia adeliensis]|uniref:Uncharacterized protein n=1 Tax=Naganishia adeliensis TaxID=92952 RepID=A0ACC2WR29_9TREE|nr:hypothetical protein QFC20_001853 [Naganishia adeliensis]